MVNICHLVMSETYDIKANSCQYLIFFNSLVASVGSGKILSMTLNVM